MEIRESNLTFVFPATTQAIKFDDTSFYCRQYQNQPEGKGIDIIANSDDYLQLIEIKNCTGHESENLWRTSTNNSKNTSLEYSDSRDSLDIEMAKKVASTIACIYGAWTKSQEASNAQELLSFWEYLTNQHIPTSKKKIMVILFLEGDFSITGSKTRDKKMIMQRMQDSIRKKLTWLNCKVSVVDSTTYKQRLFSIKE